MLSDADLVWLHDHGMAMAHDIELVSLPNGEPFRADGAVAYFDGRLVVIARYPFLDAQAMNLNDLRSYIVGWARDETVDAVVYDGTERLDLRCLYRHGFEKTGVQRRVPRSAEVLIDCSDAVLRKRVYRRVAKSPVSLSIRDAGALSARHLRIIETWYSKRMKSPFLQEMAFSLQALFRLRGMRIVEGWRGSALCGFLLLRKPFRTIATAPFMAHDCMTHGISDVLYRGMVDEARRLGASAINVGSSPSAGHYRFKMKWNGTPRIPPSYLTMWVRRPLSSGSNYGWGPRLLGI
jgi:hypothetical protein